MKNIIYSLVFVFAINSLVHAQFHRHPFTPELAQKLKDFGHRDTDWGIEGYNDLMLAIIMQDETAARDIIQNHPEQISEVNSAGLSAWHFAAARGSPALMTLLLSFGLPTEANAPMHALVLAAQRRSTDVLSVLLRAGHRDSIVPALISAIRRRNVGSVYLLLQHGAEYDLTDHMSRVERADRKSGAPGSSLGSPELREIQRLLTMFGLLERYDLLTPLESAAAQGNIEAVRKLLRGGLLGRFLPSFLRSNYTPEQLGRALSYAIGRHPEIEALLIAQGATRADADIVLRGLKMRDRILPLLAANAADPLLRAEAELFGLNSQSNSFLGLLDPAVFRKALRYYNGHELLFEAMEHSRVPEDMVSNRDSRWRLFDAIAQGDVDALTSVLAHVPPNSRDTDNVPALWHAYTSAHPSANRMVRILLERGAHPNSELRGMPLTDALTSLPDSNLVAHRESIMHLLHMHPHLGLEVRLILSDNPGAQEAIQDFVRNTRSDNELRCQTHMDRLYEFFLSQSDRSINVYRPALRILLQRWSHERLQRRLDEIEGISAPIAASRIHIPPATPVENVPRLNADTQGALVRSIRSNTLTDVLEILAANTLDIRGLMIDEMPAIEYLVLRHNFENMQQARLMIDTLVENGVNVNPSRDGRAFLDRLLAADYRSYFDSRPRVLWQFLDVLERNGHPLPVLRLRLTRILNLTPAHAIEASSNA